MEAPASAAHQIAPSPPVETPLPTGSLVVSLDDATMNKLGEVSRKLGSTPSVLVGDLIADFLKYR
jgi:hypothetical protein